MNIEQIRDYFLARSNELISLADRGDPWIFLCGSTMIDYLTHMTKGESNRKKYVNFIKTYFGEVDLRYMDFEYENGFTDLPKQMYVILRCGIVHSFSFVPNHIGIASGGRTRSILLGHEKNGLVHFSSYRKNGVDAVIFTAEQFSKDIRTVIELIFQKAESQQSLKNKILNHIAEHPPILGRFN